jgi:hypothetical protein
MEDAPRDSENLKNRFASARLSQPIYDESVSSVLSLTAPERFLNQHYPCRCNRRAGLASDWLTGRIRGDDYGY